MTEKPKIELVGGNNAFAILAAAKRAARKAGWPAEKFDAIRKEATSGDYNHLLATIMEHFEVE